MMSSNSSSRIAFHKSFYFYPEGDKNKDKYDEDFYESKTLNYFREIHSIVKSFGRAYNITCDYQHNDENPEYHMLEYTLSNVTYEMDHVFDPKKYVNIKLDFIAIANIMIEIADKHNLVLE